MQSGLGPGEQLTRDPRGITNSFVLQKQEKSMKPHECPSTHKFKYKKGIIRKQLKRQQHQQGHLQGGGPGEGASPVPHCQQRHWRKWRPQSRSSASSSTDSLRPPFGDPCRMKVGRSEARWPGRGLLILQLAAEPALCVRPR